jgi:MFS family permease
MGLILFGQALHGVCFACFLAAAFMFVDRISPRDIRGSMQNLYGTFLIGVGGIAGGIISGLANDLLTTKPGETTLRELLSITSQAGVIISEKDQSQRDWTSLWGLCGLLAFLCLVAFWLAFPSESPPAANDDREPGED